MYVGAGKDVPVRRDAANADQKRNLRTRDTPVPCKSSKCSQQLGCDLATNSLTPSPSDTDTAIPATFLCFEM